MNKSVTANNLRTLIEGYVSLYPEKIKDRNIWRKPLLATAKADNRFDILPQIAAAGILKIILRIRGIKLNRLQPLTISIMSRLLPGGPINTWDILQVWDVFQLYLEFVDK